MAQDRKLIESPVVGWTAAKFKSWIVALLRKGTIRFPPRNECLKAAYVDRRINSSTGRMAKHYRCAGCGGIFPMSQVVVDHIEAVVDPQIGFVSWDEYIKRMYCSVEGLQVLCSEGEYSCHSIKTAKERECRKSGKTFQR